MKKPTIERIGRRVTRLLGCAGLMLVLAGCAANQSTPTPPIPQPTAATQPGQPAPGQPLFAGDTELANALVAAVKAQDHEQVHTLLGADWKELVSGDAAQDAEAFQEFAQRAAERMRLERKNDSTTILIVGNDDWPFPIPLARTPQGKWFLDTESGKEEVWARRIGKDEFTAIAMCRLYVQAQKIYASEDEDGQRPRGYAEHIVSAPGKRDGLFWMTAAGEEPSPLARVIEQAKLVDYEPTPKKHEPYHGYHFRVLKAQGPDAPGGRRSYIVNGNMALGFALIAFPAEYKWTGVRSFIVNQDGKVYQKDLGPDTTSIARHMTEYNPDSSWTPVEE